jgi:hypothetical protein
MLAGFLQGNSQIVAASVTEVINELAAEGAMGGTPSGHGELNGSPQALDVDTSRLAIDAATGASLTKQLSAAQQGDRLQRVERSLARIEQINLETLDALKKLVAAVTRGGGGQ